MNNSRRSHSKVLKLPPDLIEALNKVILTGATYDDIVIFLNEKGHEISRSSVARYGRNFLTKLEKLKVIKEQAKAIVQENADAPATEMAEAANHIAMQLIMEHLMEVSNLEGEKITEILQALARLERSGVSREKLKMEFKKELKSKADQAVKAIEDTAKKKGLDPETLAIIKEQVYGIV